MWAAGTLIIIKIISIIRIIILPSTPTRISGFCDPLPASSLLPHLIFCLPTICSPHNSQSDVDPSYFSRPHQAFSGPGPPPMTPAPAWSGPCSPLSTPPIFTLLSYRSTDRPTPHTCSYLRALALANPSSWNILYLGLPWPALTLGPYGQCPEG